MFLQGTSENAFKSVRLVCRVSWFQSFRQDKGTWYLPDHREQITLEQNLFWLLPSKKELPSGKMQASLPRVVFFDMRSRWGKRLSPFGGYIQSLKLQSWQLPASQAPRKTMSSNAYFWSATVHQSFLGRYSISIPKGSMYGIFTYIYHKKQLNVDKYNIHGSSWI